MRNGLHRRDWAGVIGSGGGGEGWVVQEAALAREAVVLWADPEIQWIRILRTYEWLVQRVRLLMPTGRLLIIPNAHRRTYAMWRPLEAKTLHFEENKDLLESMPTP